MSKHVQRRDFFTLAGAAESSRSLAGAAKPARIGMVGVGNWE